ncbi:hypothetical protein [Saccharomonospora cyanea]|uniref:hypothetical protein n=1 Tax=Saccharomonospora cyanea TaxID=40989 RepID=UPI0012F988D8|nr:hypothetical protein [Saccharomonospora cyanea]
MPLNPVEQNELVERITAGLVAGLPEGWQRLVMDYVNIGRYVSVASGVMVSDGSIQQWEPPTTVAPLFHELRHGMYMPGRGTWYSMELIIDPPAMYSVRYNRTDPPPLPQPPPAGEFALDLERYPRAAEEVPGWFAAQVPGPARS